ncbi:hypothetical protein AA313_de0200633 [Arthrobotrys entomopaga]|nr:hypothetical protein AA313_de0200633 [Arthrobotrys entomopaga]
MQNPRRRWASLAFGEIYFDSMWDAREAIEASDSRSHSTKSRRSEASGALEDGNLERIRSRTLGRSWRAVAITGRGKVVRSWQVRARPMPREAGVTRAKAILTNLIWVKIKSTAINWRYNTSRKSCRVTWSAFKHL